jgi:hypothetical protein
MLSNPLYIGKLRHKGKIHDGEHTPIINVDLFERVQRQLALGSPRRSSSSNSRDKHLLTGVVFDETGERLSPTSTPGNCKRYRYYVSSHLVRSPRLGRRGDCGRIGGSVRKEGQDGAASSPANSTNLGWRIPAELLDKIVFDQLRSILADKVLLSEWLQQQAANQGFSMDDVFRRARILSTQVEQDQTGTVRKELVHKIFDRIVLSSTNVACSIRPWAIIEVLSGEMVWDSTGSTIFQGRASAAMTVLSPASEEISEAPEWPIHVIDLPIAIRRRGREQRIIIESKLQHPEPDANLVDMIGRAHFYLKELTSGSIPSIADLASKVGVHRADISRILPLAFLSPAVTDKFLLGRQPAHLTPGHLSRMIDVPASWADQARALAM